MTDVTAVPEAEALKTLSVEQKRALLKTMLRAKSDSGPVSHGQEALWFVQQNAPDTHAYNVAACLCIESRLNTACFEAALGDLVHRHSMLRSRYSLQDGRLRLDVGADAQFAWKIVDTEDSDPETLDKALQNDYRKPFDLSEGVCRAHLYRRADDAWVFLLVVHHIAIDGWSLWQLLEELQELYTSRIERRAAILPELKRSYRDFIIWQRALLKSATGQRQMAYWMDELRDGKATVPTLQLPTDRPRPAQQTFTGSSHRQDFSRAFFDAYMAFCREQEVSPFVLGLTLYNVLLHRLSNQTDFAAATPKAGRDAAHFADVVGYFVNPLPMRARIDADPQFTAFLEQVKDTVNRALANGDVPFPVVVEHLRVERDPSCPVLCQVMFVHQKLPASATGIGFDAGPYDWGGLKARHYLLHQQEGQFDLTLEILEGESSLSAHWKYNSDLFAAETIESVAAAFGQLALQVFADPAAKLSCIRLVDEDHLPQLMRPPSNAYPVEECLHERYARIAARQPERIAVSCGDDRITYLGLEQRSGWVSRNIVAQLDAIGRSSTGEPIGICLSRSIDLVVALLGVLKAGCCYIPMDPTYPRDRIRYMATDAGVRLIISNRTDAAAHADLVHDSGLTCLYVDAVDAVVDDVRDASHVTPARRAHSDPSDLAYILYTSGSTGRPKGVKVTHANVMRLFAATDSLYGFDASDVWTLFHSYAFDFSVWEIWGALLYGGRLVIVPYDVSRVPEQFLGLLARERVTVLNQTPSAFLPLMRVALNPEQAKLYALKWVVFGGEALDLRSLRPWFDAYGDDRPALVNMYGITETTVHVTYRRLREHDCDSPQSLIGQPLPDLHLLILDGQRQPVPIGFPGEVYVGGAGVSEGYLNREALNAERFVDNPIISAGRLYRTGDLARWLSPQDIAYLGRIDHQVQLRGFRIELGEIEAQISAHPDVVTATVILRADTPADARLVAYYIARGDIQMPWAEVRNHLQEHLPDYMLPSAGVQMDSFPLTDNGKTDRAALPVPDFGAAAGGDMPRDALESRIASVWAEVLNLPKAGIKDNFFELGGHSLIAARLVECLQQVLEQPVELAVLLRNPTIEALAAELRRGHPGRRSPVIPLQTQGEKAPLICIPGGSGNALYFQPLAQALGQERPCYGLQAQGMDGETAPLRFVEAMAASNIDAIKQFQTNGPYVLAGHCFGAVVAFEMAQQLIAAGDAVESLIVIDAPAPLPEHRATSLKWSDSEWLHYFIGVLEESTGVCADLDRCAGEADFDRQLQWCRDYMQRTGLLPTGTDVKPVRGMMEVFRSNSQTHYRPAATVPLPIVLIRASEFHPAFDYSAADDAEDITRSSLGWRSVCETTPHILCVPGNHISMLLEPNVLELARRLNAVLDPRGIQPESQRETAMMAHTD